MEKLSFFLYSFDFFKNWLVHRVLYPLIWGDHLKSIRWSISAFKFEGGGDFKKLIKISQCPNISALNQSKKDIFR